MTLIERGIPTANSESFFPSPDRMRDLLKVHPSESEIRRYLAMTTTPIQDVLAWPEKAGSDLSDLGIIRHMIAGNIVIFPFNADQLGPNSYDVTLGKHCMRWNENLNGRSKKLNAPHIAVYNPFDEDSVRRVWKAESAQTAFDVECEHGIEFFGIDPDEELIMLYPHEMILAHTAEVIGGLNLIVPKISGKSTSGRNMIEMCSDANMGNIGFVNCYTLEVVNKSGYAIPLVVGQAYASFTFTEAQVPARQYSGTYQGGQSPEEILDNWKPEMMLPKMKKLPGRA